MVETRDFIHLLLAQKNFLELAKKILAYPFCCSSTNMKLLLFPLCVSMYLILISLIFPVQAYMFKYDSTHGVFDGSISVVDGSTLEINGKQVKVESKR